MGKGCVICNSSNALPLYKGKGILKCQECGHVFYDMHLSEDETSKLYEKKYFFGSEYSNYLADRKVLQKNFRLRLKTLEKFLEPVRHRHLLEIGCAYGLFLALVRARFDTVQGIDICEDGTSYAKRQLELDVVKADFLKHDYGNKKFDIVCMWDTIEHLSSPQLYLEKLTRSMERGALLAITTGDIGSLNARIRKDKWRLIHPPTHVHYFSVKTLSRFLSNYGFDIIYNCYCGFYRSIDMVAYRVLVLDKGWQRLYNFLYKIGVTKLDFYLNLYDAMYVIARRC